MAERITIICGAYGSGKTEFAIAYALYLQGAAEHGDPAKVGLVDLDIVNPYFRSRDVAPDLQRRGLSVVSSEAGMEQADIPALSPRIFGLLQDHSYRVVFDVGGDPAGARALGRFHEYFRNEPYDFWVVVNPFRPDTRNADQAAALIAGLQRTSRLQATGLVANINLGRETTASDWLEGQKMIAALTTAVKLPLIFYAAEEGFYEANREIFRSCPVFPIKLRMLTPWLV